MYLDPTTLSKSPQKQPLHTSVFHLHVLHVPMFWGHPLGNWQPTSGHPHSKKVTLPSQLSVIS